MIDLQNARLQRLPAVGTLLNAPVVAPLLERFGQPLVARAVRELLESAREAIRRGGDGRVEPSDVATRVHELALPSLRKVINATGVLLHTNLGRAPLAEAATRAVIDVAEGYSTLELDLETGERGSRQRHCAELAAELVGAEDAIVVNNCAAAVLLMLASSCRGGEVIVSRGELVEIGGGFRIPDVMRESGATLVEVGTTNRVHLDDYRRAITERTRAILVVHRSNFAIVGFVAQPSVRELAALGPPVFVDLGSGLLAPDDALGDSAKLMREEPRPAAVLEAGAALVAFSGDKLLGGPQAGVLAGRGALVEPMRKNPLARAVRADKLTLSALEATLRLVRDGRSDQIPLIRALAEPVDAVDARARSLAAGLPGARVVDAEALVGGGSLPLARLPTRVVLVGGPGADAKALARALRLSDVPVIARIVEDRVGLDCRTLRPGEVESVRAAVLAAMAAAEV